VENQRQKIEGKDAMQILGEVVEQRFQIVLLSNGFTDGQERFELTIGTLNGNRRECAHRSAAQIRHNLEDNIRLDGVTTARPVPG
jgi:hypothetical protein